MNGRRCSVADVVGVLDPSVELQSKNCFTNGTELPEKSDKSMS